MVELEEIRGLSAAEAEGVCAWAARALLEAEA
jgi:hypothetical protein